VTRPAELVTYLDVVTGRADGFYGVVTHVPDHLVERGRSPWWSPKEWFHSQDPQFATKIAAWMAKRTGQVRYHHGVSPDLYLNVHPFSLPPDHGRGSAHDVHEVSVLVADLDWHDELRHKGSRLPSRSERYAMASLLPQPTMVVLSGAGVHAYWALDRSYPVRTGARLMTAWRALLTHQADTFGQPVDGEVCVDLARVLRLPFSFNMKVVEDPLRVRIVQHSDVRYSPGDLVGDDIWETCQRTPIEPRAMRLKSKRVKVERTAIEGGWDASDDMVGMGDPLASVIDAHVMTTLLCEHGWSVERETERDDELIIYLTRPGKDRGVSGDVRQFDGFASFHVFSEADEVYPFEAGRDYGARRLIETLYGPDWRQVFQLRIEAT
jgi:hypothetical protein